jgi:hypothetical protein
VSEPLYLGSGSVLKRRCCELRDKEHSITDGTKGSNLENFLKRVFALNGLEISQLGDVGSCSMLAILN